MKWTHNSPNRTPQQIVDLFIGDCFPGRKIEAFTGNWTGLRYSGSFFLAGGTREYFMGASHLGDYTITTDREEVSR